MRGKLGVAVNEGHEQAGTGREGRPRCRSSVTFSSSDQICARGCLDAGITQHLRDNLEYGFASCFGE